MTKYGSCPLFSTHKLRTQVLKKIHLRSEDQPVEKIDDRDENDITEFILADTYCVVAADENSADAIWFIKDKDSYCAEEQMADD